MWTHTSILRRLAQFPAGWGSSSWTAGNDRNLCPQNNKVPWLAKPVTTIVCVFEYHTFFESPRPTVQSCPTSNVFISLEFVSLQIVGRRTRKICVVPSPRFRSLGSSYLQDMLMCIRVYAGGGFMLNLRTYCWAQRSVVSTRPNDTCRAPREGLCRSETKRETKRVYCGETTVRSEL